MTRPMILLLAALSVAAVDIEEAYDYPGGPNLGTMAYPATALEGTHAAQVANLAKDGFDTIHGCVGRKVAWFGIIRRMAGDAARATWTVEQRYFDGLVDLHQQLASANGDGDFTVTIAAPRTTAKIQAWRLVRVIGTVTAERDGVPEVAAEYVRYWEWGRFAFMAYGDDHSNPEWVQLRAKLALGEEYTPHPTPGYYQRVIGFATP